MDAREVALLTLHACHKQGGWSDGVLKRRLAQAGLDARDAALATRLCAGVLQNQLLLDFYLEKFSHLPLKRMEDKVVLNLRLGAYQLLFLDRVPASAAVDRAVALTREHCKNPRAAGMVNGVLRALARNLERLPAIPRENPAEYLSILYSHPVWLVERFLSCLGAGGTAELLAANNATPPITAMTNTLRADAAALAARLEAEGVESRPHPWLPQCLELSGTGNLEALASFQEGLFYVQDPASRLAALATGAGPGDRVLDACAAPGGKSFALTLQMENRGQVVACDLHPHKKVLIQKGAQRLGLDSITAETADASAFQPQWAESFDVVLADVPCSGLGVIRKKPDIRHKDPQALAGLPKVQGEILDNVAAYVRPGGVLLYSTCTLLREENEGVVEAFLAHNPRFVLEGFQLPGPAGQAGEGILTLWPHRHGTDGFFMAKLRRRPEGG